MQRQDVSGRLKMNEIYWGDVFEITTIDEDISTDETRMALLNKVCEAEKLKNLGDGWASLTYSEAVALLTNALTFDLAYSSAVIAPPDKVQFFKSEILKDIDEQQTYCYSNWASSLWNGETAWGFNPLTENTFDMGIVFLTQTKLVFAYFISED